MRRRIAGSSIQQSRATDLVARNAVPAVHVDPIPLSQPDTIFPRFELQHRRYACETRAAGLARSP